MIAARYGECLDVGIEACGDGNTKDSFGCRGCGTSSVTCGDSFPRGGSFGLCSHALSNRIRKTGRYKIGIPGFAPDVKIQLLKKLQADSEIIVVISADAIEKNKIMRFISYNNILKYT